MPSLVEETLKLIRIAGFCVAVCILLSVSLCAQSAPDKAYMQKIWDGWETLNADNQTQYYAQGPHVFYDIAPLKYDSWDQYKPTIAADLALYKSGKFKINDDAQVHKASDTLYWCTATIDSDMWTKAGKEEKNVFRWTVLFQKINGKWLIIHEHVSMPQA